MSIKKKFQPHLILILLALLIELWVVVSLEV